MAGAAGGCGRGEILNVPGVFRPGTGAIRRERLIRSLFSAPQAPGVKPFACPGRNDPGALRFSHIPSDARRTRQPSSPLFFLVCVCSVV